MSSHRVVYRIAAEDEERLMAELWRHGTLGVETRDAGDGGLLVEAYFDGAAPAAISGVVTVESGLAPAEDWLALWRASAQPVRVGGRFLLDPREVDAAPVDAGGRLVLRVPARAAFGTGSHESTRLVLELMEGIDLAGRRVLDVGTGTGVLAMAALALGGRQAVGFDVDLISPVLAAQNARLNALPARFFAGAITALSRMARFELALVNVIPEEIANDLPALRHVLAPGGTAVFSGILAERGEAALAALAGAGFSTVGSRSAGEWIAYRCEVGAA